MARHNTEEVPRASMEELIALATNLAEADERLLYELVETRRDAGLSQRAVADLLGIKQSSVAAFERHDNDPRLSTIRRYALAVGAKVEHRVTPPAQYDDWRLSGPSLTYAVNSAAASVQHFVSAPIGSLRSDFAPAA